MQYPPGEACDVAVTLCSADYNSFTQQSKSTPTQASSPMKHCSQKIPHTSLHFIEKDLKNSPFVGSKQQPL